MKNIFYIHREIKSKQKSKQAKLRQKNHHSVNLLLKYQDTNSKKKNILYKNMVQ
jgi:hypothetical protein